MSTLTKERTGHWYFGTLYDRWTKENDDDGNYKFYPIDDPEIMVDHGPLAMIAQVDGGYQALYPNEDDSQDVPINNGAVYDTADQALDALGNFWDGECARRKTKDLVAAIAKHGYQLRDATLVKIESD